MAARGRREDSDASIGISSGDSDRGGEYTVSFTLAFSERPASLAAAAAAAASGDVPVVSRASCARRARPRETAAARALGGKFVERQRTALYNTRVRGMASVAGAFFFVAIVKSGIIGGVATLLLAVGIAYAALALVAARFPAHANLVAAAAVLLSTAAVDPVNDAAGTGGASNTRVALALYGSIPFVFGTIIVPRFAARAFVRLDSTTATFVCMACVLAATQEYMMERVAMQQFLVARELEHERQARREEAIVAERRRVAAEEAARFEKSFGYICHELRNPLHGVCAGVRALQDGVLAPTEAREELASISEGLALMVSITSDMTDLAKLRAGQFVVRLGPTSLRRVLESCVLAVLPAAAGRSGDILLEYDESLPEMVSTDGVRVRQIVTNGLTNAVKYAPPAACGPIHVVCRVRPPPTASLGPDAPTAPRMLSIEVLDGGPGLRGQTEDALFADFGSVVPAARTGAVGSSGLGLAICNRLARLLGGELHVTDRVDGVTGTRFVLTLPAAAGDAAPERPAVAAARLAPLAATSESTRLMLPPLVVKGQLAATRGPPLAAPARVAPALLQRAVEGAGGAHSLGMNVLLVDDSSVNRRAGVRMLAGLGCSVTLASDGDEVPQVVAHASENGGFDVILMDITMARVSGDAACAALRAAGCQIPVIAVSGNLEAPDYVRRYGFSAMLGKPFTQEQLREALQVYVPPRHA